MSDCLRLKKSNCKNCYKCIRHCPVKAIRFSGNQANIIGNECILCGQCFVVCPQNAKEITSETEKVRVMIQSGAPVIASLAPSFAANYDGVGIDIMRAALKKLGFADAEETAVGATIVKNEYQRMLREEHRDVLISSCCHSVNLLIQKYFPQALPCLADTLSPMQAHCRDIKARHPDAETVFIGPCVAKKDEADYYGGYTDAVLTFEELTEWMRAENVVPEKGTDNSINSRERLFPTSGGILDTMNERLPEYTYIEVDGVANCIDALHDITDGKVHRCFIEMSACEGSCIGGPVMEKYHRSPIVNHTSIKRYAGKNDFIVTQPDAGALKKVIEPIEKRLPMPTDDELRDVLKQMGKTKPEDELNCGSCGYNTCREKAVAVFQGKAEISMCLPYLKEKAESFSDNIVNNSPNGIIVLNDKLEVQKINPAAMKIMNIRLSSDVLGEPVVRILDPKPFLDVIQSRRGMPAIKTYLAEYGKYVEQSIVADNEYHLLICLMRDITDEENELRRKEEICSQTADIADKVVDKQMRIVQEIASLLGETAAETKIALTKLKESIKDE